MTQHRQFVPEEERAHSVGQTGGLPGANADPRAAEVQTDELATTVARGDVSDGLEGIEARDVAPDDPDQPGAPEGVGEGRGWGAPTDVEGLGLDGGRDDEQDVSLSDAGDEEMGPDDEAAAGGTVAR
jgi:hypothetical protein